MTIAIIGASGRCGRLVVEALMRAGHDVRSLSRDPERAREQLPAGARIVAADAVVAATLDPALRGARALMISTPVHPQLAASQINIIDAAVRVGIRSIVKLSGSAWTMQGSHTTTIGRAHAAVEAHLHASPVVAASIRPNAITQSFFGRARSDAQASGELTMPIGTAAVATVDLRDIAAVITHCLQQPTEAKSGATIHEITGGVTLTGRDVATVLSEHLARPITYRPITIDTLLERERGRGAPDFLLTHLAEVFARISAGDAARITTTIPTLLGRPARSAADYLRE